MTRSDVFQMLLLSAVWGVSFLLIRVAGEAFPPLWVALLRSLFGVLVLGLALRLGGHRLPPLRLWRPLLLVALLNNVVPWTFFAWGEQTVSSNIAAVLNATTPLFSLLIGLGLRDTSLGTRLLLGVLLGFGGVGLTVLGGVHGGHATLFGVLIITAASVSYAVATAVAKRTLGGLNPIGLATTQLGLSTLMLLPLALAGAPPARVDFAAWAAMLVLGVFGSGLAYLLYYGLLARVSATQVLAVTYVLPVWGLFWAAVAGERPSWLSAVGVAVVLAGLLLMNAPPRRSRPAHA
ncbi:putative inner membrane transporter YedA [Deinococcus carri]|uniref:Inner membrane transporter YedA n=1 Tax=Deinococcus carri TaxID=1211323 RepID=A0ABP9W3J5_9DEIO